MPGAQVSYTSNLFHRQPEEASSAVARTTYAAPCETLSYRPSGEDRSVLADVIYHFRMVDNAGIPRWDTTVHGTVVTEGLNTLLDYTLKSGSGGVPSWYCGLVDGSSTPVIAAADTMGSHAGWSEVSADYSEATRPALTLGTIAGGAVDNSASLATFSFTAAGAAAGAFITTVNTKGGSTGKLYDVGLFSDGYRTYGIGWTLYLSVTCSIAAA